jgi:hypothetical protein
MTAGDESGELAATPVAPASQVASQPTDLAGKLATQRRAAATWLFVIGGLTALNAVLWLIGSNVRMVIGLASTRAVIGVLAPLGLAGLALELLAVFGVAASFVALGVLLRRGRNWALWVGIALYAVDFLVFVVLGGLDDIVSFGFRMFALLSLAISGEAIRRLSAGRDLSGLVGREGFGTLTLGKTMRAIIIGILVFVGFFGALFVLIRYAAK